MTMHLTPDERELIKLITNLSVPDEIKARWTESINENGLTEGLAEEIRKEINDTGTDKHMNQTRFTTQLHTIIQRWRLSRQAKSFKKH